MKTLLRTPEEYELFLYTLTEQFPSVRSSTIVFIRRGVTMARVTGELQFEHGIKLVVRERILYNDLSLAIHSYGYEVWQNNEKLYWYDSQSHPNEPALASTHPHHKHIPPDIKHNRIPAPIMSFTPPNLPELIFEIEQIMVKIEQHSR